MKIDTNLLLPQKFATNIKSKIDQKQPKIDIVARFFARISQKLAPTRKTAPTDQHFQHDFAALLHRFFVTIRGKDKKAQNVVHETIFHKATKAMSDQSTHCDSLEAREFNAQ